MNNKIVLERVRIIDGDCANKKILSGEFAITLCSTVYTGDGTSCPTSILDLLGKELDVIGIDNGFPKVSYNDKIYKIPHSMVEKYIFEEEVEEVEEIKNPYTLDIEEFAMAGFAIGKSYYNYENGSLKRQMQNDLTRLDEIINNHIKGGKATFKTLDEIEVDARGTIDGFTLLPEMRKNLGCTVKLRDVFRFKTGNVGLESLFTMPTRTIELIQIDADREISLTREEYEMLYEEIGHTCEDDEKACEDIYRAYGINYEFNGGDSTLYELYLKMERVLEENK